jgi:hypothetical protein
MDVTAVIFGCPVPAPVNGGVAERWISSGREEALQAINAVHEQMRAMLVSMQP